MAPKDAIISATRNAAYAAGIEDKTGSLVSGKYADLLVVDGDPLSNVDILLDNRKILFVMKEGNVYKNLLDM
jgi:imidazolonepropionase-like amidohydrolase